MFEWSKYEIQWALTSNTSVKKIKDKVKRYVGYFIFFSNPCLVTGKKFIFTVVQRDLRGIRKLWSLLCSWWWISLCLQSLLQPQTPGKMRRWNVSPHVAKSNTSHNGTLDDSHLGLKATQQSRTGENTCHIRLSRQIRRRVKNRYIPHWAQNKTSLHFF